jgi:GNAT superfamily N-acetyltransferase
MEPQHNSLVISQEDPHSEVSRRLMAALTNELAAMYGDDGGASSFTPDDALLPGAAFVVARLNGEPIGCGAIRPLESATAEVKRMYVTPGARGRGVSRQILQALELTAQDLGYIYIRLETGLKQSEAIRLYESSGYIRVDCYGRHVGDPMSVCFQKRLERR